MTRRWVIGSAPGSTVFETHNLDYVRTVRESIEEVPGIGPRNVLVLYFADGNEARIDVTGRLTEVAEMLAGEVAFNAYKDLHTVTVVRDLRCVG